MINQNYHSNRIVCTVDSYLPSYKNYFGGIIHDETGKKRVGHYVSVVGWGEENGERYWIAKNSRGS